MRYRRRAPGAHGLARAGVEQRRGLAAHVGAHVVPLPRDLLFFQIDLVRDVLCLHVFSPFRPVQIFGIEKRPYPKAFAGTGACMKRFSCGATRLGANGAHSAHTNICRPIDGGSPGSPTAGFSSPSEAHSSMRPAPLSTRRGSLYRSIHEVLTLPQRFSL